MEKKHSLSNSLVRTKVRPYVRYNKETDELIAKAIYEEEVVLIEPTTADEYNKEVTERFHKYEENKAMGKVKEYYGEKYGMDNIPKIDHEPFYIPVKRDVLDPISRIIILADSVFGKHPGYEGDRETVDKWLTEMYSKQQQNGNGSINVNRQQVCEEDH